MEGGGGGGGGECCLYPLDGYFSIYLKQFLNLFIYSYIFSLYYFFPLCFY